MVYVPLYSKHLRDNLGQAQLSSLERCPYFRGSFVHISMYVAGTVGIAFISEMS